jgi:multidrug resistance efflux pump
MNFSRNNVAEGRRNTMGTKMSVACLVLALGAFAGCKEEPKKAGVEEHAKAAVTNRVEIGPLVRQNLGVTFAKVESRAVTRTLRVPGTFELLPTARREYRTPAAGKVELLVEQYQKVEAGAVLYRVDSPRWREIQEQLIEAESAVKLAQAAVESIGPMIKAHETHHAEVEKAVELWTKRLEQFEKLFAAGGARGDEVIQAKASLASARAQLTETLEGEVELAGKKAEGAARQEAAKARQAVLMESAASLTGKTSTQLAAVKDGKPAWQGISHIDVVAQSAGVVEKLDVVTGAWVDANALVLVSVQPELVRFRASAMQSDIGRLTDGMDASVVAPQGGGFGSAAAIHGLLTRAPTADGERRTIELVMTPKKLENWARPGIAGYLEVVTSGSAAAELAVPMACVVRDGTQALIFRRDPADPNKAIRMPADLGPDDGRWVVIKSGIKEGDEVVQDGVYQLMVATSGSITKGGHFHSDGTFHEGNH